MQYSLTQRVTSFFHIKKAKFAYLDVIILSLMAVIMYIENILNY